MKKIFQLLLLLVFVSSTVFAGNEGEKISDVLTKGKWVDYSDGYVPIPTYKEGEPGQKENPKTVKRFKTFSFDEQGGFLLDSAKQRYSGKYQIIGDQVHLNFNKVPITHLRINTDPNRQAGYYQTKDMVKLPKRVLELNAEGQLVGDGAVYKRYSGAISGLFNFYEFSGFANISWGNLVMMVVGLIFIYLAIRYDFEPMLLIPIGFGILVGNIPMFQVADFNLQLGVYEPGSVLNILYQGVVQGWYPPLIFLGIGAMTDFSSLISNPKLMLLGAAAQIGIFLTFLGAIYLGFAPPEAGAIGIIGGADGPTAIFISSKLANGMNVLPDGTTVKNLIGPIAIAAYSYMALVPVIQPPVIKLMTSKKERRIKMKPPRAVSKLEKVLFPIVGLILTAYIAPSALPLIGMFLVIC